MTARPNKMRRIDRGKAIYILPNLCTTLSLFSGFLGIMSAVDGYFVWAACAILISLVMDGLDGKVARVTGTTSRFGVEYDSLADLVAFGVGPAIMAYMWALKPYGRLGWLAAFIFVACGALRLARFNVQVEEKGTKNFVGLPIPAAASMVACSVLLADQLGISGPVQFWPILVMMFVLSFLMVSNIPYVAFKRLGMAHLRTFNGLVAFILFISLIAVAPQIMGFVLMASYVVLGPFTAMYMERRRKKQEMQKKLKEQKAAAL